MKFQFNFWTKITSILSFLLLLFSSCAFKKDVIYYQNMDALQIKQNVSSYEVKIQPDDLLMIIVSAEDAEAAIPFNLKTYSMSSNHKLEIAHSSETIQQYLVDEHGIIDFPILGKLQVGGFTRTELLQLLKNKISLYVKNPLINLRITNFKISIQGEVNLPGTFSIASERVTVLEALSMAKDLTIYGKRKNILIIRENNGVKSFNRVDITNLDFINSPFYYLAQNDIIYVEPNKTKINSSVVGSSTSVLISAISILMSIYVLILK